MGDEAPPPESLHHFSPEYAAFFAPRTHVFETVDLRTAASAANLRTLVPTSSKAVSRLQTATMCLSIAIGVVVAVVVFLSDQITRGLVLGIYRLARTGLEAREDGGGAASFARAICAMMFLGTASVTAASMLAVFVAPLASSSGIPQLKASLNGVRVPAFLALKTAAVKAVGVALSTGGGLISGRQGAMGHVGAAIGAGASQAASAAFEKRFFNSGPFARVFRALRTEEWKLNFAAVGAAIGIATTFSAPMGGWMWIFEEAVTHWDWRLGFLALGGCLSGVLTIWVLKFLSVGMPGGFLTLSLSEVGTLTNTSAGEPKFLFKDLPGYLLLGVCGGVFGALLPAISKRITLLRYRYPHPAYRVGEVAFIAALVNAGRIAIPYIAGDCRVQDAAIGNVLGRFSEQNFSQFDCPDGFFSPYAAVIYNPLTTVIRATLYAPGSFTLPLGALGAAAAYYAVFIVWSFGLPVPAGVFLPSFVFGSVFGRLVGVLVQLIFPSRTDLAVESYAFVGVVATLSGVSRGVSVSIIALEATGLLDASHIAVLVGFVAKQVGDALYAKSIYSVHIALKGMPYLHDVVPHPELYYQVRVADVMSTSVMSVRCRPRVEELLHTLSTTDHNAFPVFYKNLATAGKGPRSSRSFDVGYVSEHVQDAKSLGLDPAGEGREKVQGVDFGPLGERPSGSGGAKMSATRTSTSSTATTTTSGDGGGSNSTSDLATDQVEYAKVTFADTDVDEVEQTTLTTAPSRGVVVMEDPELGRVMPLRSEKAGAARRVGDDVVFGRRPLQFRTSIVLADGAKAFSAAFFENGVTRHVEFGNHNRLPDLANLHVQTWDQKTQVSTPQVQQRHPDPEKAPGAREGTGDPLLSKDPLPPVYSLQETSIPEFSLIGIIDRATLLALLDASIHRKDDGERVERRWFDSAWPNNRRAKNAEEVFERVRAANIGRLVIDLQEYLDPDPLFISDRAMTLAAYKLFRRTGARHILVSNTRESLIGGIITRKDILPASIRDTISQLHNADVLTPASGSSVSELPRADL